MSTPTFEDLVYDDSLNDLERIATYGVSKVALQRLVHVKLMGETMRAFPFAEAAANIMPVVERLVEDEEFLVRQQLAVQLGELAEVSAHNGDEGYSIILQKILPAISQLVNDNQPEVRKAAATALCATAAHVKSDDVGQHVLTIVIQLAHDDDQEDLRITAAILLNSLAVTLGPDLCQQFVIPEVVNLAEDPVFRVRKTMAFNLDNVCRTAGPENSLTRIFPSFVQLSKDDIWGVRKACAESIVHISQAVAPAARLAQVTPVMERLLRDVSKWVTSAAQQHLGQFIATLRGSKIPHALLQTYLDTGRESAAGSSSMGGGMMGGSANELAKCCAFSFPAVVLQLGRARWSELRELFAVMIRNTDKAVRCTLAHSLHEVGRIIGPEQAESDLLPAFDLFMRDIDDVKTGVIKHVASFLSTLSPGTRESYLPVLNSIRAETSQWNWRFRFQLGRQLPLLAVIFSPAATYSVIFKLVMELLQDPIAEVRNAATKGIGAIVLRFGCEEAADLKWQDDVARQLFSSLKLSTNYATRIMYPKVCFELAHLIRPADFERLFLKYFIDCMRDPTSNIRLVTVSYLASDAPPPPAFPVSVMNASSSSGVFTAELSAAVTTNAQSAPDWLLYRDDVQHALEMVAAHDADPETQARAKIAIRRAAGGTSQPSNDIPVSSPESRNAFAGVAGMGGIQSDAAAAKVPSSTTDTSTTEAASVEDSNPMSGSSPPPQSRGSWGADASPLTASPSVFMSPPPPPVGAQPNSKRVVAPPVPPPAMQAWQAEGDAEMTDAVEAGPDVDDDPGMVDDADRESNQAVSTAQTSDDTDQAMDDLNDNPQPVEARVMDGMDVSMDLDEDDEDRMETAGETPVEADRGANVGVGSVQSNDPEDQAPLAQSETVADAGLNDDDDEGVDDEMVVSDQPMEAVSTTTAGLTTHGITRGIRELTLEDQQAASMQELSVASDGTTSHTTTAAMPVELGSEAQLQCSVADSSASSVTTDTVVESSESTAAGTVAQMDGMVDSTRE